MLFNIEKSISMFKIKKITLSLINPEAEREREREKIFFLMGMVNIFDQKSCDRKNNIRFSSRCVKV